jgi:hypothetical protein
MGTGGMGGMMGLGGLMGGRMYSQGDDDEDSETTPLYVEAVIEIREKDYITGQKTGRHKLRHAWGETWLPFSSDKDFEITRIKLHTVAQRFEDEKKKIRPNDVNRADKLVELAEWALQHGLLKEVPKVIDELAKVDPKHKVVTAFRKMQAAIEKDPGRDDPIVNWKDRLGNFKVKRSKHYTLFFDSPNERAEDHADNRLNRLEDNFRGFFYWFTLRGIILKVPDHRLVAILETNAKQFDHHHEDIFDNLPMLSDGFYARRENLAVFSGNPTDAGYRGLQTAFNVIASSNNLDKGGLLKGEDTNKKMAMNDVAKAQTYALMLQLLQDESEVASVSYEGTRQLIAAIGLLPPSIEAPQWIDFGVASFFETPKGSFWTGYGAPSHPYLINYKIWEATNKLDKPAEALKAVVTDGYFRKVNDSKNKERALDKARTMTWALTYYLAQKHREKLRRYYDELADLPRDLEFDADVLWAYSRGRLVWKTCRTPDRWTSTS